MCKSCERGVKVKWMLLECRVMWSGYAIKVYSVTPPNLNNLSVTAGMAAAASSSCPTRTPSFTCRLREFKASVTFVAAALRSLWTSSSPHAVLGEGRGEGHPSIIYITVFIYSKWLLSEEYSLFTFLITLGYYVVNFHSGIR